MEKNNLQQAVDSRNEQLEVLRSELLKSRKQAEVLNQEKLDGEADRMACKT